MKWLLSLGFLLSIFFNTEARQQVLTVGDSLAVKSFFFSAISYRIREEYPQAEQQLLKVIAIDSNSDASYYELANIQVRLNRLEDAEVSAKKAVKLQPNNVWYLRMLADVLKVARKYNQLLPILDKLITAHPQNENLLVDKMNVLLAIGDKQEAEKLLFTSERKFPNSAQLQKFRRRIGVSQPPASGQPDKELEVTKLKNLAIQQISSKQYIEAEKTLLNLKQLDPANFQVYMRLAHVYNVLKLDKPMLDNLIKAFETPTMPLSAKIDFVSEVNSKAKSVTQRLTVLILGKTLSNTNPNDGRVAILYGDLLLQSNRIEEAKSQYKLALKLSEDRYIAWEKLLSLEVLSSQFDDAITTSENALARYPNQALLYYYRAFALHKKGRISEANFELRNAFQLLADDVKLKSMAFALSAEINIDLGKIKEADAAFSKAIELAPANYRLQSNYAYFLALRNQQLEMALVLAQAAAKALPQDAGVLDSYAFVLFKHKDFKEALRVIELALQNKGDTNGVYLEHYGDILFMNGITVKAVSVWEKALINGNSSDKLKRKIDEKKYIK